MATSIRLYMDENLSPEIANQLRLRSIDAVSVRDLNLLGDSDENHLTRAMTMGRVLVTSDADFLVLSAHRLNMKELSLVNRKIIHLVIG